MSTQTYLIDTNVIIHLEDNKTVEPAFSALTSLAAKHKVDIFVHEAARDDVGRDKDTARRAISLSKLEKFQTLSKVRGLTTADLSNEFGPLPKHNDIVDATLLHALHIGAVDFLVSQDRGLHERARRHSRELGRRVLYVADAVYLLRTTYEPIEAPVRFIDEVAAHAIPLTDIIFDSLREDYPGFDKWWTEKCVKQRRLCWIIEDDGIAGLLVRKDEIGSDTDATEKANKILKICTFKVRPDRRGLKLGELLLKKVFWFAQKNKYDLVYVTTYEGQTSLIDLLEYFGFRHTATKKDGERVYEKRMGMRAPTPIDGDNHFDVHRLNYPRFPIVPDTAAFGIPIKEDYHDILYPDLMQQKQLNLFGALGVEGGPRRPGNENARRRLVFQHLQASDLIKAERRERQGKPVAHDLLREGNIDDNQALLISGFMRYAPEDGLVVLDGHTVIDTPDGLVEISPSVFSAIDVSRFVVLVDDVEKIALRRLSDTRRTRPTRSHEELAEHQERSVLAAYRAALALSVPLFIVPLNEHPDIVMFLDW